MKKLIFVVTIGLFAMISISTNAFADKKQSKAEKKEIQAKKVKKMIDDCNFYFLAQSATPMSMPAINNLSYGYSLKVTSDTIVAYLPYFGRAYSAPINNADSGINFTSTNFEYLCTVTKSGWEIKFQMNDTPTHNYQMTLNVSKAGYASLQVMDDVRQAISFAGIVSKDSR